MKKLQDTNIFIKLFSFEILDIDKDDHYDSVDDKKKQDDVTNNPYYGVEAEGNVNNKEIRQSTFDGAENVKVSENPYYE